MRKSLSLVCTLLCLQFLTSCSTTSSAESKEQAITSHHKVLGDKYLSHFYQFNRQEIGHQPGKLLREEALLDHQSVPGAAKNVRLLYTSTDGLDETTILAVSGALFLPDGEPPKEGWPIILWSHGTVGIADHCAPSWTGYVPFHQEYLGQWLSQGFAILASDYQGLGTEGIHPYLATQPAAYSNLDLLRAMKKSKYNLSDKVVVVGQSQGASAAIATAAYAESYAPDLSILGVVATGVPFFSPEAIVALQQARPKDRVDPMLGYNFLALTLVEQLLPDFSLEDYVFDSVIPTARAVADVCNRDMRARITEEKLSYNSTFKKSPEEPLKTAFGAMGIPTLKLPAPIYVGVGALDKDTPPKMQANFISKACTSGSQIQAVLYQGHDHLSVLNHSTKDSIPFVKNLFIGNLPSSNCNESILEEKR